MELEQTSNKDGTRSLTLTALEKAIIGLFSAVTFSMLTWVTITTNETARDVAVMQEAIAHIEKDADKANEDRFTGVEGKELERRVQELERYHR